MADEIGTVTGTQKQSIARIQIEVNASLAQDDWLVQVFFEDALYDASDNLAPGTQVFGTRTVTRRWSQIKDDPDVASIYGMMHETIYAWRDEDIAFEETNAGQTPPIAPPSGDGLKKKSG